MNDDPVAQQLLNRFGLLQEQLEGLLQSPERAKQLLPYSYVCLPDILGSLRQLQGSLKQQPLDRDRCRLYAAGLGRLTMEYVDLPESDLGEQILWLASDIITMTQGSSD
jgi:hypothetical protein